MKPKGRNQRPNCATFILNDIYEKTVNSELKVRRSLRYLHYNLSPFPLHPYFSLDSRFCGESTHLEIQTITSVTVLYKLYERFL